MGWGGAPMNSITTQVVTFFTHNSPFRHHKDVHMAVWMYFNDLLITISIGFDFKYQLNPTEFVQLSLTCQSYLPYLIAFVVCYNVSWLLLIFLKISITTPLPALQKIILFLFSYRSVLKNFSKLLLGNRPRTFLTFWSTPPTKLRNSSIAIKSTRRPVTIDKPIELVSDFW